MTDRLLTILTLVTAIGCGLIGGVFFAFSSFVMAALGRLPPPQGIAAMQSINVFAITPWFMSALFGTALACIVLAVVAVLHWQEPGAALLLAGGALYVIGAIVVTMAFNVPLNDALAAANPSGPDGAALWARYLTDWTGWNHVRTMASLLASAALIGALLRKGW
jgi:uncharacterized membrane protein